MATNNLFNVPSWTSIRELFYRRLGIALDPGSVDYSFAGTSTVVAANQVLSPGTINQTVYPLSVSGVPVTSVSGFEATRLNWDGLWPLTDIPYTNVIPDSDNFAGAAWQKLNATATETSTLYAGVMPYWEIASTAAAIGNYTAGILQFGLFTMYLGETWTFTLALRASPASNPAILEIAVGGKNNGTDVISSAQFISGPGSIGYVGSGNFLMSDDMQTNIGLGIEVTGLSATEDSLLEIILVNNHYDLANISVGIGMGEVGGGPLTLPVSVLATRVQLNKGGPLPYRSSGAIPTAGANYSISGGNLVLTNPQATGDTLTWGGNVTLASMVTVAAKPTLPDGSKNPYYGSVAFPIHRLQITNELPPVLVWSDLFPMTVDALADYLFKNYSYYMEDGEFSIMGDPSSTPLVRGGGVVYNGLNALDHTFKLQATVQSIRWHQGSQITFVVASAQSIVPANGFAITSTAPVNGSLGQPYSYTYTVQNGTPPYTYAITQGIAPGSLNAGTGILSSIELVTAMTYSWIIQVTDAKGRLVTRLDQMTVAAAALTFAPASLALIVNVGVTLDIPLGVSGGQPPYTYTVYSGALPPTVSLTNNAIQGTFEGNLNSTVTQLTTAVGIQVTDAANTSIQRLFTFTINDRGISDIQAALRTKVLHWFEYSTALYGSSAPAIPTNAILYDATGRANMQVEALPGYSSAASLGASYIGRTNQPYGFGFGQGAYARNNTVAFNLPDTFALMALVNYPTTPVVQPGQKLLSRGADTNGGYALAVGADGSSVALDLTMSGVPVDIAFPTQVPPATGNWYFVIAQKDANVPEMEVNAGSIVTETVLTGTLTPNDQEALFLGVDPDLAMASIFTGGLGMIGLFTDKLWSDERKWLYNQGAMQAFEALAYWPTLTLTADSQPTTLPLNEVISIVYTIAGGSNVYLNVDWTAGSQVPPGLFLSYDGVNTITLSGSPTLVGSYSFGVTAASADGQAATVSYVNLPVA